MSDVKNVWKKHVVKVNGVEVAAIHDDGILEIHNEEYADVKNEVSKFIESWKEDRGVEE